MKKSSYRPKAIAGQSYAGHVKINKLQLDLLFSHHPEFLFSGFIVGNKVSRFHFFAGWHLACGLENKNQIEMAETLNSFEYYLDAELGNRAAIYVSKQSLASLDK